MSIIRNFYEWKWKTNLQLLNLHRQRSFPLVAICQFDINFQFAELLSIELRVGTGMANTNANPILRNSKSMKD